MVSAIILAGGLGTRLAETVPHLPKALAPIRNVPFLKLLLEQIEASGIARNIVLALGYKADAIQTFVKNQRLALPVEFSVESAPLGTGGALLHALPLAPSDTLLVLNGDTHFDLSLPSFLDFHKTQEADATLACREVPDVSRYGSLLIDPFFRITSFREKSLTQEPGWINGGVYLIEKKALAEFPSRSCSIEKDLFPLLLQKRLLAFPSTGSFIDIGTPTSYTEAQDILKPWIPS
jgi:D-glycero-alpha-D-manno-heptose 1-phosphate guanylyltransferase